MIQAQYYMLDILRKHMNISEVTYYISERNKKKKKKPSSATERKEQVVFNSKVIVK